MHSDENCHGVGHAAAGGGRHHHWQIQNLTGLRDGTRRVLTIGDVAMGTVAAVRGGNHIAIRQIREGEVTTVVIRGMVGGNSTVLGQRDEGRLHTVVHTVGVNPVVLIVLAILIGVGERHRILALSPLLLRRIDDRTCRSENILTRILYRGCLRCGDFTITGYCPARVLGHREVERFHPFGVCPSVWFVVHFVIIQVGALAAISDNRETVNRITLTHGKDDVGATYAKIGYRDVSHRNQLVLTVYCIRHIGHRRESGGIDGINIVPGVFGTVTIGVDELVGHRTATVGPDCTHRVGILRGIVRKNRSHTAITCIHNESRIVRFLRIPLA